MKKDNKLQASYRFPESLLLDLREVSELTQVSQTEIVKRGIRSQIRELKARINRRREAEQSTV